MPAVVFLGAGAEVWKGNVMAVCICLYEEHRDMLEEAECLLAGSTTAFGGGEWQGCSGLLT